jgi:putative membrane-bound dehydrogenase-like protein
MKVSLALCFALGLTLSSSAASGPVRVLFAGKESAERTAGKHCHNLMRDLGRDAIWFDYVEEVGALTPDYLAHFDVVLSDGLAVQTSLPVLRYVFTSDDIAPAEAAADVAAVRALILKTISPERRKDYEAFIAQREPEQREPNAHVANYEKRAEALTFQKPMSVKASMERTQVPADMELRLFASEPDIKKPIAMAWDERGRCWVAETEDYPHGLVENGMGHDDIKVCEDTNGDGRADKFTVFADHLNIPTGLVLVKGGVIVSQPPRFLFLKDTDGDGRADVRQEIFTGYGIRDTHAQASNLHYGYDNWLYGCVGYSGFEGRVGEKAVKFTMGTYRFKADGSALEFLHQFTNNSWAQSMNDAGDQFGGTANGAPIFYGGIPASAVPSGVRVMTAKKINEVETAHTITPNYRQVDVFNGYTAAAGSNFIYSDRLPGRLQGGAMVCEPTMKLINLMKVVPQGAGYTARDGFSLVASSDEWMSPVHAEVGPDGAIWFCDWQNFIIQHNPTPSVERGGFAAKTGVGGAHENDLRDHARGRIYRVVTKGQQGLDSAAIPLGEPGHWVQALSGGTPQVRLTAQRLIVEGAVEKSEMADLGALGRLVLANDGNVGAVHALWALHGLGKLDESSHRAALLGRDAKLRRNAVRALGTDAVAQGLFFGTGVINDADLHTRLAAMVKLAEFTTTPEIKQLVSQLLLDPVNKGDEWLNEATRLLAKKHEAQAFRDGPNLLANEGLEELGKDGLPVGWRRRDYNQGQGNKGAEWAVVNSPGMTHSGKNALRCITRDNGDTSFYQDAPLKLGATYKLSAWVKTHAFKGKLSLNDHIGRSETDKVSRDSDWVQVEAVWTNKGKDHASINLLHVGKGDGLFDDVQLCEQLPIIDPADKLAAGDVKRGEGIFWNHPIAACKNCHVLKGQGSVVGPALDGIAGRKDEAYITESLMNPNAKLAEGYVATPISPMPPMGLILKPQELADVKAFILSLK